jgi:hypothetical protein
MVVLSSLKVTATEVAVVHAEPVLDVDVEEVLIVDIDVDVDVLFEVVAAAVELVVPCAVVSCSYITFSSTNANL